MIKIVKTFLCLVLFCLVTGFSDLKQNDEYSCGPVCAANCAINILNQNFPRDELIQTFTVLAKTDKNGTTSQNLCSALEKFFLKTNLKTHIKYYGIRKVERKYNSHKAINICEELHRGSSVILNLGFYKYNVNEDSFRRIDGHYVNAYACKEGKILIADPYNKEKTPFYIELEKAGKSKIKNTKDNEKYSRKRYSYYKVSPGFDYQKPDETVFLNGIITVYPHFI